MNKAIFAQYDQVQVAYADVVLLNKSDLASKAAVIKAEAFIRGINSRVKIIHTTNCVVDLDLILNRRVRCYFTPWLPSSRHEEECNLNS